MGQRLNSIWQKYRSFFPLQLIIEYFKRDYLILLFWLILFLVITGKLGTEFGLQYIFLSPEYMGKINALSFLFLGIGVGSFIMAFNVSSYVATAHRYPFLATVKRPFEIFSFNNLFFPLLYILVYVVESFINQVNYEMLPTGKAVLNLLSFLLGISLFVGFAYLYFYLTEIVLYDFIENLKVKIKNCRLLAWFVQRYNVHKHDKLKKIDSENLKFSPKVKFYLGKNLKIHQVKKLHFINNRQLTKTFTRQHIHAFFFAIITLSIIFLRGLLSDNPQFIIPAAASIHVFFTVVLLILTLFYVFFGQWSVFSFIVFAFILDFINPIYNDFYHSTAFGLNYSYRHRKIEIFKHTDFQKDSLNIVKILNTWHDNYLKKYHTKPYFVVISTSGGGMKQAFWTYYSISFADSLTNGRLLENTRLMTGASGGMLGIAYLREIYRQQKQGLIYNYRDRKYLKKLSSDILNPVLFGLSMSDIFMPYRTFKFGNHRYIKNRAYLFEHAFNLHTNYALNKPLAFYRPYEQSAQIPMLIITPTILNVGTRLIISPLNLSFLVKPTVRRHVKNIEFSTVYKDFDADSLNFLSAIRMNASFPYVTPTVILPGRPKMKIMDAGLNDNYGFLTAFDFVMEFKDWIKSNTNGLIFINICENEIVNYNDRSSFFKSLFEPAFSLYNDWDVIENFNYHDAISKLKYVFGGKFHLIELTFGTKKNRVSLSWHLTRREKHFLLSQIYSKQNQKSLQQLQSLLR